MVRGQSFIFEFYAQDFAGETFWLPQKRALIWRTVFIPLRHIFLRIGKEIEEERVLVEANRKLIEIFEWKIQAKLAETWGDGEG